MTALNQPLTPKKAFLFVCLAAALAAAAWGGWRAYEKLTGRPPSTAEVKRSIWHYLKKQTGASDFSTELAADSVSNTVDVSTFTNKAGRVKTAGRARRGPLGLPETTISVYFRTNQAAAATYEQMYRLIGQQLQITEHLLESDERPRKMSGLVMASEASAYAKNNALNLWLAARICEAYLWPNLSIVEGTNGAAFTPDALLNICDAAFQEAGETNNIIRNYEYLIAKSSSPQQVDAARFRLARLFVDTGDDKRALALLKQIKNFKTQRVEQQIAAIEQRLKGKR